MNKQNESVDEKPEYPVFYTCTIRVENSKNIIVPISCFKNAKSQKIKKLKF